MVKKLKRQKYFLLAISHSPRYVVDDFCNKMGFDKVYGRIFELNRSRRFTGRIFYSELIDDKAKILKRAVAKEGLTMKGSIGVGDTESDIKFLKLVDKPICFNPNRKLYQAAKRNNWPVVIERKDVVYRIKF
jgi:phosphoserine phosphatase